MLKSLSWKLTLSFIAIAITTAALVAVFIRVTSTDRLTQLVVDQQRSSLEQSLVAYYETNGSWKSIDSYWQQLQLQPGLTAAPPQTQPLDQPNTGGQQNGGPNQSGGGRRPPNMFGLADANGVVVVSVDPNYPAGSKLTQPMVNSGAAVMVNNQKVGTILNARQPPGFSPAQTQFLDRTNQALTLAVLVALLVALVMGIFLARTLSHPLQELTKAAQSIAQGKLEQQVSVKSKDEIGQLADAFNRMSQEVVRVNLLRKRMTADIAHDLRTPLTVIGGYVESMRDGVLQPTTERLSLIYTEIERLQFLVSDLRMLSQVDAGELPLNPQRISPASLLSQSAALFQHHAGQHQVTIRVAVEEPIPEILVDESRMMQVMDNLVGNALRYTPEGGEILLSARSDRDSVEIIVKDTGPGIDPQELPFVFDRFYRGDQSRHSETGESGLGLAIVKALVEAQKGQAWAESLPGEGASIHLKFGYAR